MMLMVLVMVLVDGDGCWWMVMGDGHGVGGW